ncbi:hypothetical protein SAMN03159343_1593 [Klenkia marina]|uniref:Uncharacterized protein n=1 Tax=Klenkia marina TaxID=1960309 RepID=A0A1G4XW91_9ACTN|nr:hypothetical protein [Klenkia marina]SCX45462.1 hypothetical protein SAMN03159343_1593 [Klenkia marina]
MTAPVATPPSVRVAAGTLLALGVLLVASATLTLVGQDAVVDRFVAAQPDLDRAATTRALVLGQALYLVLGAAAAVGGVALLRRRPWGRWLGLTAALFLGLRTVLSTVTSGGTTVFSLLVLVLCVAAATSLLARTTRGWLVGQAGS